MCIRTEEAAEGICTYRYEYKGRGFQMKKHVIAGSNICYNSNVGLYRCRYDGRWRVRKR